MSFLKSEVGTERPTKSSVLRCSSSSAVKTDLHRNIIISLINCLSGFFRNEKKVYVSGNLFIYFKEEDPIACVAPDCFVVKGVSKKEIRIFKKCV
mgnify:CR=1 FL=1